MKRLFLILLFFTLGSKIYSQDLPLFDPTSYYNVNVNSNVNANVNVNKNVDVSGTVNVNKNITTIDYGALAQANANREKIRLEASIYANNLEKQRALEIASNPLKAFDYGRDNNWPIPRDYAKRNGIRKADYYHKVPHKSLFVSTGGYNYRNENLEGVITEIEFVSNFFIPGLKPKTPTEVQSHESMLKYVGKGEQYIKDQQKNRPEGEFVENIFTHKNEISKATVFGEPGFVDTWFYEDEYEYVIKDNYYLFTQNGWYVHVGARYKGDKKIVDFEMLEGRRFYFKRLVNQTFATAGFKDVKY